MHRKIIVATVAFAMAVAVAGVSSAQHVRVFSGNSGAEGFSGGVRVATGDVNGDGRDGAEGSRDLGWWGNDQEAGLLLPAIQKVREAAARTRSNAHRPTGPDSVDSGPSPQGAGLLLPAIQKAREAGR